MLLRQAFGRAEVSPFKMCPIEVGVCEMRFPEDGVFEMRPGERGAFETRAHEDSAFEMSSEGLGAFELGSSEVRAAEVSAFKVRSREVGTPQNSLPEMKNPLVAYFKGTIRLAPTFWSLSTPHRKRRGADAFGLRMTMA